MTKEEWLSKIKNDSASIKAESEAEWKAKIKADAAVMQQPPKAEDTVSVYDPGNAAKMPVTMPKGEYDALHAAAMEAVQAPFVHVPTTAAGKLDQRAATEAMRVQNEWNALINTDTEALSREIEALEASRPVYQNTNASGAYDARAVARFQAEAVSKNKEIDDKINALWLKKSQAKKAQTSKRYNDMTAAEDYATLSKDERYKGTDEYDWIFGREVRPEDISIVADIFGPKDVQIYEDLVREHGEGSEEAMSFLRGRLANDTGLLIDAEYRYLNDEERDLFRYILNKEGAEAAEAYLEWMRENVTLRRAAADHERRQKNRQGYNDVFRALEDVADIGYAFGEGVNSFKDGMRAHFTDDAPKVTYGQAMFENIVEDSSGFKKGAMNVAREIGRQAPSMALAMIPVVGKPLSQAAFATSAAGNARAEALKAGYSPEKATEYGWASGLAEVATGYLIGGNPILSRGSFGKVAGSILGKGLAKLPDVLQTIARFGLNLAGDVGGEYFEERLQEGVIGPILRNEILSENNKIDFFSDEAKQAGEMGFWTSLVMNAIGLKGQWNKARSETYANNMLVHTEGFNSPEVLAARENLVAKVEAGEVSEADVRAVAEASVAEALALVDMAAEIGAEVEGTAPQFANGESGVQTAVSSANTAANPNGVQGEKTAPAANAIERMSATVGSEGAKTLRGMYTEAEGDEIGYVERVLPLYNAGKAGKIVNVDALSRAEQAMYNAGLIDAKVEAAKANATATPAPVSAPTAVTTTPYKVDMTVPRGKVKVDKDVKMSRAQLRQLEALAKNTNTAVTVGGYAPVDANGNQNRGWYVEDDGHIHVYADARVVLHTNKGARTLEGGSAAVMVVAGHEFTHRLKTLNAEGYKRFANFALDKMGDYAESLAREKGWSRPKAEEEAVCDFAMQFVFSDEKTVREITRTDSKLAALVREIIEKIRELLHLNGEGSRSMLLMMEEAASIWKSAYDEAVENVKNGIYEASTVKDSSGNTVAETDGNGGIKLSESTYDAEGRDYLEKWLSEAVQKGDLDQTDATDIVDSLARIYDTMQKFHGKYASYDGWRVAEVIRDEDGNPLLSVIKENGEYAMNLDFSLVCKKRRALDAVLGELIRRGTIGNFNLNEQGIATINNIIKKHGLEIACDICFVDAKRYRQGKVADQFADVYNNLVRSLVKDKSKISSFNFVTGDTDVGITEMADSELDFSKIDKIIASGKTRTVPYKVATLLKEHPEYRKLVSRGDFMNSQGFTAVKRQAPEVLKLYNSKKGSGGPKASFGDVQYLNDVLKDNRFYAEAAYSVGGVRLQSFSDYVARLVFDYAQEIADLSAKKLPAHAYTKEALFAKQFGLTGIKINLSLIPMVVDGGVAPGLDANGNYAWADESFDFDTAVEIENAEGYRENCGTIAVGVSKAHIEKLLSDPNIRMVIPYHKSSLNPIVAKMRNIAAYTDYTKVQSTRDSRTGKKLTDAQRKSEPNFNDLLREHGDPKAAAQAYLDWCDENGYIPKFDEFAGNENYYKLLTDFAVYDQDGTYHPQGAVTMSYPDADSAFGDMESLIESGLAEDQKNADALTSELSSIVDEIEATLPAAGVDFEMKRTGVGLSLNMPFSAGLDAPAAETKNTAEGGVKYSRADIKDDARIVSFVKDALARKDINTREENPQIPIATISSAENSAICKFGRVYERKYTDGEHLVDAAHIRHIEKTHGNVQLEALRAQLPVTEDDIIAMLSAIANGQARVIAPSYTLDGNESILQEVQVNGYTLYAEEIVGKGKDVPANLEGRTIYKTPTKTTAASLKQNSGGSPRRLGGASNNIIPENLKMSSDGFLLDENGRKQKLYFSVSPNGFPEIYEKTSLTLMSSDKSVIGKKNGIKSANIITKKPFYITSSNRVYSSSEDNVLQRVKDLKNQGYDCFIFDYHEGDRYAVMVTNKAQIVPISEHEKHSTSGNDADLLASVYEAREVWKRAKKMTPMQIANMQLSDVDPLPKVEPRKPSGVNAENGKESKFYGSAMRSDNVFDETRDLIESMDDVRYYYGLSNEETLNEANDRLNLKGQTEANHFFAMDPAYADATDIAEGFILLKRYQDKGDFETAAEVARKLREMGTSAGQTVQTFSILGRLTPEGMAIYAQKELDQIREEMIRKHSAAWVLQRKEMFQLTAEEMEKIRQNMILASALPDGRDKTILIAEIASMLEAKLPTTVLRMIKAWTRNCMLLNPKTMLRNVLGNAIMMPAYTVEDFTGAMLDKHLAKKSGVRTKGATFVNKDNLRAFGKGVYESYDDFRRNVNTRQAEGDRFELGQGNDFHYYTLEQRKAATPGKRAAMALSNALNKVDRVTGFLLDMGDRPFFEAHFVNSINNQCRLNGVTEPTAEMVDIATTEALQRTWQDDNGYTKFVQNVRNGLNFGKSWGLGSIIVPFTKTPANLTKALIEYSPAGLVKSITYNAYKYKQSVKIGKPDIKLQKAFVDSFAKGVTGTLTMALGMLFAHIDWISGGDDDEDKDVAQFKRNIMGIAPYSVTVNGISYTYDWAQPIGGLFAISADVVKNIKNGNEPTVAGLDVLGTAGNAILDALSAGGNVLFEQSFLQGIADLFGNDNLMSGLIEAATGVTSQFVPTALGQIAQMCDPYVRTSFYYDNTLASAGNKAVAKIPGARNTLAPVVDVLGHEVESFNAPLNVMFNPSNMYAKTATEAAMEIYRVYEATGDATVVPRVAPYYLKHKGEKYEFTPHERAEYQRVMGSTNEAIVTDLLKSKGYAALSAEARAQVLALATDYATAEAKYTYLGERGVKYERDSWMVKAAEGTANGVSVAEFILAKAAISDIDGGYTSRKTGKTIDNSESLRKMEAIYAIEGLTDSKRKYLFEALGVGESVRHYNKACVARQIAAAREEAGM